MGAFGSQQRLREMAQKYGEWRMDRHNNYRAMVDAGVKIGAQTDLPLFIPDVAQSIYHCVSGRLGNDATPLMKVSIR